MEYPDGYVRGLPNCGIIAIASLTGTHYDSVWNWFKKRNDRSAQWRGYIYKKDCLDALHNFGKIESKKIFEGDAKNKGIGEQKPIPLHYWVGIFGKKFPNSKFLVKSNNHFMAVDGDIILDQSGIGPVKFHKSKGRRITDAWIVE